MNEISLNTLKILNSLNNKADSPAGIKEKITIVVSKIFQPSLKKSFLFSSAANLIAISMQKKIVIK